MKRKQKKHKLGSYVLANRIGSREADTELFGPGFKSVTRVHKSDKRYSRKNSNNIINENDEN